MSLRLPSPHHSKRSACCRACLRVLRKTKDFGLVWGVFERVILAVTVALVKFWIVENGGWSLFTRRNLAQDLSILFQKRVDHFSYLACNPNHDPNFSAIGS